MPFLAARSSTSARLALLNFVTRPPSKSLPSQTFPVGSHLASMLLLSPIRALLFEALEQVEQASPE
jgi:hypothetical protein